MYACRAIGLMVASFAALTAAFVAVPAAAAVPVDLELALAIDVSGSIDEDEAQLQREGYIAAFRHPDVIKAIQSGILGRIAVSYFEWAGYGHKRVVVDWTVISDAKSSLAFAETLTQSWPDTGPRTAIGDAITFAVPRFAQNEFEGTRRVVDISGDGPNNWGEDVAAARDKAVAAGVIINGLPIINDKPSRFGRRPMRDLDVYYKNCVIGGPGAFIVVARSFKDFATAVRKKLILEIVGITPQPAIERARASLLIRVADEGPVPCDTGEFGWRRYRDH